MIFPVVFSDIVANNFPPIISNFGQYRNKSVISGTLSCASVHPLFLKLFGVKSFEVAYL